MPFGINLWNMNASTAEAYKNGYADCEKKYKQMEKNYEVVVRQLKKLGYEVGEDVNIIKSASNITQHCKSMVGCDNCVFYIKKAGRCTLSGDSPSSWRVS